MCAQLDGLPLALEILAARADIFSPTQLNDDLKRGLDALEDGPRDLPARHRTLRNTIRWSTRLLNPTQRSLFAHISVFAGSFDAPAVRAVYGLFENRAEAVINGIQALTQASLVQAVGPNRWRMLEPIRQFAEEMLTQQSLLAQAKACHPLCQYRRNCPQCTSEARSRGMDGPARSRSRQHAGSYSMGTANTATGVSLAHRARYLSVLVPAGYVVRGVGLA